MVYGYHAIFGTYGFWLPNDPRGSWSDYVGLYELYRAHGPATTTGVRRSLAHDPHDSAARVAARKHLPRPAVQFSGLQVRAVALGFADSFRKGEVTVWACAILPNHVHVVFGCHARKAEQIVNFMKGAATRRLLEEGFHPFLSERDESGKVPRCWARGQWVAYLDTEESVGRAIHYTQQNPIKDGLPLQRWSFVVPFEGEAVAGAERSPEARG